MSQNEFNELSDEINEEETNNEDDWEELKADKDYLININYPHQIKKKKTNRIIKEYEHGDGYIRCSLNGKYYYKHRLIAEQFIENDDPENKIDVDHINHNRSDNHISNIRWCSRGDNCKNKSSSRGIKYTFYDVLPESAEQLDSYNGYDLDGVYIDYENEKLYLFNGVKYRELTTRRVKGNIYYRVHDIENKRITLTHKVLFG